MRLNSVEVKKGKHFHECLILGNKKKDKEKIIKETENLLAK